MEKQTKGPYSYSSPRHISFLTITLNAISASRLPLYSSEYSRKDYTQHQLLAILLLKTYLRMGYREILEQLETMDTIRDRLGLHRIPHHTTVYKSSKRLGSKTLNYVFKTILTFFYRSRGSVPIVAIDSTGFRTNRSSLYYSIRSEKLRKDFLKVSIAIDTLKKTIIHFKISKSRHHDSAHAKSLLRGSYRIKRAEFYVMDRGYDAESIHRQIRQELGAAAVIPLRDWGADYVSGEYRSLMKTRLTKLFIVNEIL